MNKLTKADLLDAPPPAPVSGSFVKVGLSSCGIAAGAQEVFNAISAEVSKIGLGIEVLRCGCSGMCYAEPLVEVAIEGLPSVVYGRVTTEVALRIVEEHLHQKRIINDHVVDMSVRR